MLHDRSDVFRVLLKNFPVSRRLIGDRMGRFVLVRKLLVTSLHSLPVRVFCILADIPEVYILERAFDVVKTGVILRLCLFGELGRGGGAKGMEPKA
jgi:hypothetical protein